jgi:hypothetical protein
MSLQGSAGRASAPPSSLRELTPSLPNTLRRRHSTVRAQEQLRSDLRVGLVARGERAISSSRGVRSSRVQGCGRRTVSPVVISSQRAYSAKSSLPNDSNTSWTARRWSRESARRRSRRATRHRADARAAGVRIRQRLTMRPGPSRPQLFDPAGADRSPDASSRFANVPPVPPVLGELEPVSGRPTRERSEADSLPARLTQPCQRPCSVRLGWLVGPRVGPSPPVAYVRLKTFSARGVRGRR